jgi:predicted permease
MPQLIRRIQYLFRRRRLEADLAEEIEFHRAQKQQQFEESGVRGSEAVYASRRALGNVTLAREDAHSVWTWRWAEDAWQDARYTVRSMRRQPAFAVAAIAIVALGTGATTCVFSLLDGLVVKSLPVERPDRLVWFRDPSFSYPIFSDVRATLPGFDGLFAWAIRRAYVDWHGRSADQMSADILEATPEFFPALRVKPAVGRTFESKDTTVAVISHAVWRRHFGADPSVVGRTVRVGDVSYSVIGVAPAGFFGVAPGLSPEVFVPLASRHTPAELAAPTRAWLHMMGRLKDGVSIEQADVALQAMWPGVMASTTGPGMPDDQKARYLARKTALQPGRAGYSSVRNLFRQPLWLLMALVTLLLATACASVANLLLARGVARRKEIAVRLAIGANRARVFRQLLTEALVLTFAGAAIGLLLASWAGGLLVAFMTTTREHLALDTIPGWRMAGFTVALAIIVSVLAAVPPSLGATRGDVTGGLKETGQPGAGLLRRWSAGKFLVAVQVALALMLLSGAAVFGRSLARVLAQDSGMDSDRIVVVAPDATAAGYKGAALHGFYAQLLERLRALPGVESAALSWMPPISHSMGSWTESIAVDGRAATPSDGRDARSVLFNGVSPRYFATVGMALGRGRDISDADTTSSPKVVIVNHTFARRFFGARDPVGHRISIGKDPSRQNVEIVGIVQDAKYMNLQEPARSIAYLPAAQVAELLNGADLVAELRVGSSTAAVAAAARQASRTTRACPSVSRPSPIASASRRSTSG